MLKNEILLNNIESRFLLSKLTNRQFALADGIINNSIM